MLRIGNYLINPDNVNLLCYYESRRELDIWFTGSSVPVRFSNKQAVQLWGYLAETLTTETIGGEDAQRKNKPGIPSEA